MRTPKLPPRGRRAFLRGLAGVTVALPFLEGLRPRKSAAAATGDVEPFAIFVRQGNGVAQATNDEPERFWPSSTPGPLTEAQLAADTGRAISELSPYASKLVVVRGLNFGFPGNGCGHSGGGNQVLTAARVSQTPSGNESLSMGESIDNRIQRELGAPGTEPLTLYVGRKYGYLDEVLSYRQQLDLRSAENNPYNVYLNLFGLSTLDPEELERLRNRRNSVNDLVRDEMQALLSRSDLSKADRDRLDLHFTSIRDLEAGLICGLSDTAVADIQSMAANSNNDDYFEDVCRLQFDVLALAMACGVARAATVQLGSGNDGTRYWINGTKQNTFHRISHRIDGDGDVGDPIPNADMLHHLIDRKLLGLFRHLLDKLDEYQLEQGSLLDHGVAVFTNDLSNKWHSYQNVPYILAGGAKGAIQTGRYVDAGGTTNNKILNVVGAAVGCVNGSGQPLDDFGDSSLAKGFVPGILA